VTVVSDRGVALTSNYVVSQYARLKGPMLAPRRDFGTLLDTAPGSYIVVGKGRAHEPRRLVDRRLVEIARDGDSVLLVSSPPEVGLCTDAAQPTASSTGSAMPTSPPPHERFDLVDPAPAS
jgi:hypothetical protein